METGHNMVLKVLHEKFVEWHEVFRVFHCDPALIQAR